MGFSDLIKPQKVRDKEAALQQRRAFREAERAAENVKYKIVDMKTEMEKAWTQAKLYYRDGQKAAAQRLVQLYRKKLNNVNGMEAKSQVFEKILSDMAMAKCDQDFTCALKVVNKVVQIDPEAVVEVMGEVEEKQREQVDIDRLWKKMNDWEMVGIDARMEDAIPSMEEMEHWLEDEVATEISEDNLKKSGSVSADVHVRIDDIRRHLKDLAWGGR